MDILHLVDRLEELVNSSRSLPFTHTILVDEDRVLELIDQMRVSIPEEVKKAWLDRLMRLQQGIAEELNQRLLGKTFEVLVDEESSESGVYLGRTYADAPEVDGQVFIRSALRLSPGEFVHARVVDTTEYDLVAETT